MVQRTHPIVQHLASASSELEAFDNDLQSGINPQVYNQLAEWIGTNASNATAPIWNVVGNRCERLATLANQVSDNETQEQAQARIRNYFQNVTPGAIAKDLQAACELTSVWRAYEGVLSRLESSPQIGPVARRYHLPREVVASLCSACMHPLHPTFEALWVHAEQMKAHGELLQSLSSEQGARTGLRIAASVAGGFLLGPIGAIGARLLTGAATDPTAKVNASAERVGDTFEGFRASFASAMEAVDGNVLYTLVSLYGGLFLRIEQDLNTLGKSLVAIDLNTGAVQIGLSPKSLEEFDVWARSSLKLLRSLRNREQWGPLGDAADKALRITIADPLRASVVGADDATVYTIEFARMRAAAINRAADIAWREGRTREACDLYRHLISGTNVAWERVQEGQETPEDEALYIAGLRLAIAATRTGGSGAIIDDLAALPAFVAQAIARFDASEPWISVPGEGLAGTTLVVATTIAAYAHEQGHDLRLAAKMPAVVERNGGLAKWAEILRRATPPASALLELIDEDTRAAHAEASGFLAWLVGRTTREKKRKRFLGWAVVSVLVAGLVVGGYLLVRWLVS